MNPQITMKRKGLVQPEQPGVVLGGPNTQAISVDRVNGTNPLANLANQMPPPSVLQPQAAPASPAQQPGASAALTTAPAGTTEQNRNRSKYSILNRLQMPGRRA